MGSVISLECSAAEFYTALRRIRIGVPKARKGSLLPRFEIEIRPDAAILSSFGAQYTLPCTATGFAKVIAPYAIVVDFAKRRKVDRLTISFGPGKMELDKSVFESSAIELVHPENQTGLGLVLNYKDLDLVRLRNSHNDDELERMGVRKQVENAEERLRENLNMASRLLAPYEVSFEELEQLVEKKVRKLE